MSYAVFPCSTLELQDRTMPMQQNTEIIKQWSNTAQYWEKHRDVIREMFAPVTDALIQDAEIKAGQSVLDVATGPGEPALTIAGLVGSVGKVVGTDVAPEMVEAARREAHRRGLQNADFEAAFAESLPFADGTFDAVLCRFGIMFFPSPIDAVREWLRILKPGGRIALAVWHFAADNPFHCVISQVIDRYVEPAPAGPDAPDAYRFAESGKLLAVLAAAGVTTTTERLLRFAIRAPMTAETFWTLRCEMSEKLRTRIAGVSEGEHANLKREAIDALTAYSADGVISFPAEVLIVSGKKNDS